MNRRELLLSGTLSLLAGPRAFAQDPAPPRPQTQPSPPPSARLLEVLQRNRLPLTMTEVPAGPGWDWLVQQARGARFTLVGEEHGVAETARFSAALFQALRASGYSRVAIELSPVIAQDAEAAARRGGMKAVVEFLLDPDVFTFFNLREEAQFVADVVKAAPAGERVLRGFDREIFSDRYLISRLGRNVPPRAKEAFGRLKDASMKAWAHYQQEPNGDNLFLLAGDPALASAVRAAWPDPDPYSDAILRTLEASLAVEAAERAGGLYPYMERRTQWNRENLLALLREEQGRKTPAKVIMKFGYNHMIRGANYFNFFDLGAMVDEVATLTGDRAFHILVLPGPGSRQAVPGPGRTFVAAASDGVDEMRAGDQRLSRVLANAEASGHEVIDLRAARPFAVRGLESWNPDLVRTIHGYDAALIWKGAIASSGLEPTPS